MARIRDVIRVESEGAVFDRFQSLEVVNDIAGISEAIFEVGDDGSYADLRELVAPGREFTVYLNGHPRLRGRAEVNEVPGDTTNGVLVRLIVRTKLTDARYASAEPVKVEGVTVKAFVLGLYSQLGFTESDFKFAEFGDVELMTGKSGKGIVDDFEAVKIDQAKIQPPETVYAAVERHLKRFKATHWDGPLGEILVGRPNDQQRPLYRLQAKRGAPGKANNIISFTKIVDWSEVPSTVTVYGSTQGKDITASKFKAVATDEDVEAVRARTGHFYRPVIVQDQQSTSLAAAERAARRELSARIRRKDAWEVTTDGWSYWNGSEQIPWANNTVVDIDVESLGQAACGPYLIVRVSLKLDLMGAATTSLTMVAPGVWVL
jgi:hypothetical protein